MKQEKKDWVLVQARLLHGPMEKLEESYTLVHLADISNLQHATPSTKAFVSPSHVSRQLRPKVIKDVSDKSVQPTVLKTHYDDLNNGNLSDYTMGRHHSLLLRLSLLISDWLS